MLFKIAYGLAYAAGVVFALATRAVIDVIYIWGKLTKSEEIMLWCSEAEDAILAWYESLDDEDDD